MKDLDKAGLVMRVHGQGPPVLDDARYAELASKKFSNESELVQWFTPILQDMVRDALTRTGYPLALVNSERHAWVEDPNLGAPSKPDMIVVHSALYTARSSPADAQYHGNSFVFGELAHFDLCDSISATLEWKVDFGENDFRAFGQALDYVRRMASIKPTGVSSNQRSCQRIMIANRSGFALSTTFRGTPTSYVSGEWNSPGSRDAVVDFFSTKREWLDAMDAACRELKVSFVAPQAVDTSCFLGRGASGRVFLVSRAGEGAQPASAQLAVKVSLGRDATCKLKAEVTILTRIARLSDDDEGLALCVTRLVDVFLDSTLSFGALLIQPVGKPIGPPFTMYKILGALQALRILGKRGLFHGDARWPNVLWVGDGRDGRAVWTDFQFSFEIPECRRAEHFVKDVEVFLTSLLNVESSSAALTTCATAFFYAGEQEQNSWKGLRDHFQSAWQAEGVSGESATP